MPWTLASREDELFHDVGQDERNIARRTVGDEVAIQELPTELPQAIAQEAELGPLSDALDELATVDPWLVQLVDLKFFCGFSFEEISAMRSLSERTVRRDWNKARIYLHKVLRGK